MSEPEVNAILSFRDEDGREWLAAAVVGPLIRDDAIMAVEALKDRAFTVCRFTVVTR